MNIFENAQRLLKIDYKQDDQIKAVQEIVDLIAIEPPIIASQDLWIHFKLLQNAEETRMSLLQTLFSDLQVLHHSIWHMPEQTDNAVSVAFRGWEANLGETMKNKLMQCVQDLQPVKQ